MNIYGIEKRTTYKGTVAQINNPTYEELEAYRKGLTCVATSYTEGYINNDMVVITKYEGKYGTGIVECTPSINPYTGKPSSKYMNIAYYVKEVNNAENKK